MQCNDLRSIVNSNKLKHLYASKEVIKETSK